MALGRMLQLLSLSFPRLITVPTSVGAEASAAQRLTNLPGTESTRGEAHGKQSIDLVGVIVIDEGGSASSKSWEG